MFKKLILLVLIALLAIPAITGCSSNEEQPAAPAVGAATEEKPANPTSSPTPTTTPPEKVSENPGKAISVPDLVKLLEENENAYEIREIIIVSGIVRMALDLEDKDLPPNKSSLVKILQLGESTESNPYDGVRIYLKEPAKVKIGDKVTVKGTYAGTGETLFNVLLKNGVVQ